MITKSFVRKQYAVISTCLSYPLLEITRPPLLRFSLQRELYLLEIFRAVERVRDIGKGDEHTAVNALARHRKTTLH